MLGFSYIRYTKLASNPTFCLCMNAPKTSVSLQVCQLPDDAVEVAKIGPAWGVKGWFKVFTHNTSNPEAIFNSPTWYLQPPAQGARHFSATVTLPIKSIKPHADTLVAQSAEIVDRTQAEQLQGARVFVPRSAFPKLEDDEYYWVDLIGCQVLNLQGETLGEVHHLLSTGPQNTLVIARPNGEEGMIPFVDACVQTVDIANKRIVADWQADYWD